MPPAVSKLQIANSKREMLYAMVYAIIESILM